MISLKNDNIFNGDCEAIVIPVSVGGTMSDSFRTGMEKLEKRIGKHGRPSRHELGEIEMISLRATQKLKYVFYAYVVGNRGGSYTYVREVMHRIGAEVYCLGIKSVGCPVLGTGAGNLNDVLSYRILTTSFFEVVDADVVLNVFVPQTEMFKRLETERIPLNVASSRQVFDAELPRLFESISMNFTHLQSPYVTSSPLVKNRLVVELLRRDSFYYETCRKKFQDFFTFNPQEEVAYYYLYKAYQSSECSIEQFISELKSQEEYDFFVLCKELEQYISQGCLPDSILDEDAVWPLMVDAEIQKERILNLIKFKEEGRVRFDWGLSEVRNAISFYLNPGRNLSMLSENHRKQVIENLLVDEYEEKYSSQVIFDFFKDSGVKCVNLLNKGVLYSHILYAPTIRPLWWEEDKKCTLLGQAWNLGIYIAKTLVEECLKKGMKELDLGGCGLTDLEKVPELFMCEHIETLVLSNEWGVYNDKREVWEKKQSCNKIWSNVLSVLPEKLGRLKNLKRLICGGNWHTEKEERGWNIKELGGVLKLTNLEYLNLSNNKITDLTGLGDLSGLKVLHLNNNRIVSVRALEKLEQLEEVYLSDNEIEDVEALGWLTRVVALDLHANQIRNLQSLEEVIARLGVENGKWKRGVVCVAQNPLEIPPMEVVNTGKEAILQYFKDIKTEKTYVNSEVKVVLAGNSGVGKTTLAAYLKGMRGKDWEEHLRKPHASTHWVKEEVVKSRYEVSRVNGDCDLHVFDFGGHDYYHDTHHVFYSGNSLYVLLWDEDSNRLQLRDVAEQRLGQQMSVSTQDYPLHYWLESIKRFIKNAEADNFEEGIVQEETYNSAVLVVQNKVESTREIVHLDGRKLVRKFPFVFDFVNVSLKTGRNMQHFDCLMKEMLEEARMVGVVLPMYYQTVKQCIDELGETEKPIVSMREFHLFCNKKLGKKITLKQASFLKSYLKQVGTILLYVEDGEERICIRKGWVIERIYGVLDEVLRMKGEFGKEYVEKFMAGKGERDYVKDLIGAMLGFKIIFQHPYEAKYIAPMYLPVMPESSVELFLRQDMVAYRRIVYTGFIHKRVILQFFQLYGQLVVCDGGGKKGGMYYYWKDGLIVKDQESEDIVMIRFDLGTEEGNAFVDVFDVRQRSQGRFVERVLRDLREINKEYETEEMVTLDGKLFVSLEVLNECAEKGKLVFTRRRKSDRTEEEEEEKELRLKDYSRFLTAGIRKKKAVISYSKEDIEMVHAFKRHIRPLVDDGLIDEIWNDEHLRLAGEWNEEIQERFAEADIVFFMVSSYFYNTEYIREHEIKDTIHRYNKDRSVKIVSIVLEYYDWGRKDDYNLKRFVALPFQAKPICDFLHPDIAWFTITETVRRMIECDWDSGNVKPFSREIEHIYERIVKRKLDLNAD